MDRMSVVVVSSVVAIVTCSLFQIITNRLSCKVETKVWKMKAPSRKRSSLQKQNMIKGLIYSPMDAVLAEERLWSQEGCALYNKYSLSSQRDYRDDILFSLVGGFSIEHPPCIEGPIYFDYGYNIYVGRGVFFNYNLTILDVAPVCIGDYCMFGPNVSILTATHPLAADVRCKFPIEESGVSITIGNKCWIGANVTFCPGSGIGDNCVVAAGAVVAKQFGSNVLIGGCPAKIIRNL